MESAYELEKQNWNTSIHQQVVLLFRRTNPDNAHHALHRKTLYSTNPWEITLMHISCIIKVGEESHHNTVSVSLLLLLLSLAQLQLGGRLTQNHTGYPSRLHGYQVSTADTTNEPLGLLE